MQRYKLKLKHEMKKNYKASFAVVFDDKLRFLIKNSYVIQIYYK